MHARDPSGIEQFPLALAKAPEPSFQLLFEHKVAAGVRLLAELPLSV